MKTNFHTHNYRCGHANGSVEDYVKEAVKNKYSILGISDHAPLPKYFFDRMKMRELEIYLGEIDSSQKKYGKEIKLYKSLEIEYFEDLGYYYEELREILDYILLGLHMYISNGEICDSWDIRTEKEMTDYADHMVKAIKSGFFDIIAHPDLFVSSNQEWSDTAVECSHKICKAALEMDIPMEVNANGIRKTFFFEENPDRYIYPYKEFWEIAKEYGNRVIVGSDCHDPKHLDDKAMHLARQFAKDLKLNVIEKIEI